MKNLIAAPLALLVVALTLSGCFYGPRHGYYGGGGGGYDRGPGASPGFTHDNDHGPGPGPGFDHGPGPGGFNHP